MKPYAISFWFFFLGVTFVTSSYALHITLVPFYLFMVLLVGIAEAMIRHNEMLRIIRNNLNVISLLLMISSLCMGLYLTNLCCKYMKTSSLACSSIWLLTLALVFTLFLLWTCESYVKKLKKHNKSTNRILYNLSGLLFLIWFIAFCPNLNIIYDSIWLFAKNTLYNFYWLSLSALIFLGGFDLSTKMVAMYVEIINTFSKVSESDVSEKDL